MKRKVSVMAMAALELGLGSGNNRSFAAALASHAPRALALMMNQLPTTSALSLVLEKNVFTGGDTVRGYVGWDGTSTCKSPSITVSVQGIEDLQYDRCRSLVVRHSPNLSTLGKMGKG